MKNTGLVEAHLPGRAGFPDDWLRTFPLNGDQHDWIGWVGRGVPEKGRRTAAPETPAGSAIWRFECMVEKPSTLKV